MHSKLFVGLVLVLIAVGCDDSRPGGRDATVPDASRDTGQSDVGVVRDSGPLPDAGALDSGADAGPDTGRDAGSPDSGTMDAGRDAGSPDSGTDAGPPHKRVFVTARRFRPDFGGTAGADALCQSIALGADLGGTWMAWISDSGSSPSSRFVRSTLPYRLLNGATIAVNWDALTVGSIETPINLDEVRAPITSLPGVWTNTATDGTESTGLDCADWISLSNSIDGSVGRSTRSDEWWSATGGASYCNGLNHLYCFEQ